MKKTSLLVLVLILLSSAVAYSQSLKDLLYKGKLKNDSNTVVRKTDDLSTKIDTGVKKPAEPVKTVMASEIAKDTSSAQIITTDSLAAPEAKKDNPEVKKDNNVNVVMDNTKMWKVYMDSMVSTFNTEVLPSKKVKKETYYVFVDYEIAVDGQVNVNNIIITPENSFLQDEIKQRLMLTAPKLNPVTSSTGKAMKSKKRYNFTLTKS
jgi:hypothetical protein